MSVKRIRLKPTEQVVEKELLETLKADIDFAIAEKCRADLAKTKAEIECKRLSQALAEKMNPAPGRDITKPPPPLACHIVFNDGSRREFFYRKQSEQSQWLVFTGPSGLETRVNRNAILLVMELPPV